jgi:hypothetical protein
VISASLVPDYASLEQLYRLRALMLSIRRQHPDVSKQLGLTNFLSGYSYQHESNMPPSLAGLLNYSERRSTNKVVKGNIIHRTILRGLSTVSGGVSMRMPVDEKSLKEDKTRKLMTLAQSCLNAKPGPSAVAWITSPRHPFSDILKKSILFLLSLILFLRPIPRSGARPPAWGSPGFTSSHSGHAIPSLFQYLLTHLPIPIWIPTRLKGVANPPKRQD